MHEIDEGDKFTFAHQILVQILETLKSLNSKQIS